MRMNCSHSKNQIILGIFDEKLRLHLDNCTECSEFQIYADRSMQILDEPVELPETLYAKIIQHKDRSFRDGEKRKDISLFLQFSTVIAAAVILGIVLGFHANPQLFFTKNQKKQEALIEFRESHHLNVDRQRLF